MADARIQKLAQTVVQYSVALKPGEKVMINCTYDTLPLVRAIVKEVYKVGAMPFVNLTSEDITSVINSGATEEQVAYTVQQEAWKRLDMQAAIHINVPRNEYEMNMIDPAQRAAVDAWTYQYKCECGVLPTPDDFKWTVLSYPTYPMAKAARMSQEEYEDLYFEACLIDYPAMEQAMFTLQAMMDAAKNVHIVGPGTDLRFCIEGCKADISAGTWNMPDGEVLCVPQIDSANGEITYNVPSMKDSTLFENVHLVLKDGVIVEATANYTDRLNEILDIDEGARRIGEFAIGTNSAITRPSCSTLFDEKMSGTFHFTPGQQIARIGNGNTSQIHWDLVRSHLPQHGGSGEIWFDDVLLQKDGFFIDPALAALNPRK